MPLKRSIVRGLSLFKPNHNEPGHETTSPTKTTTPYFPPAPTKTHSIKKPWLISGRQPTHHPILQPHQIRTLLSLLSLPHHTPLLSTRIAALGPPLARPSFTNPPLGFCKSHFWFEGKWIEELTEVIRQEIGPRLARLRSYNCERDGGLGEETREILGVLEPYLHLFPILLGEEMDGEGGSEKKECHRETCSICNLANCPACKLSLFLQNPDAVRAIRICAFGRKKKHEDWPEACAWLDPEPGSDWEARWRREGNEILRDRASVQRCEKNKKARLSAESGNSSRSEYSRGSTGATSVASDRSLRGKKSSAAESLRDEYLNEEETAHEETADGEKTWAEDFPVEEYTNKVKAGIFGSTRGTSARRESFANMEDAKDQHPRFTRSTSVSRGPLSHMEDIKPRRLRSVRGTCAPRKASFPSEAELTQNRSSKVESFSNEAELTQHRSSTVDYDTFLSEMRRGKEDLTDGDEEDREARAAAWAREYEQLTGECAQTEWCRPGQPSHDYETVEETPFF